MNEAVAHCEHQLDRTRTENSALQRELHARQEVLDSLNETVVIKVQLNSKRSEFFFTCLCWILYIKKGISTFCLRLLMNSKSLSFWGEIYIHGVLSILILVYLR